MMPDGFVFSGQE